MPFPSGRGKQGKCKDPEGAEGRGLETPPEFREGEGLMGRALKAQVRGLAFRLSETLEDFDLVWTSRESPGPLGGDRSPMGKGRGGAMGALTFRCSEYRKWELLMGLTVLFSIPRIVLGYIDGVPLEDVFHRSAHSQ